MAIEIKIPRAVQIRRLKALHSYLTEDDISKLTGYSPSSVRAALSVDKAGSAGRPVRQ